MEGSLASWTINGYTIQVHKNCLTLSGRSFCSRVARLSQIKPIDIIAIQQSRKHVVVSMKVNACHHNTHFISFLTQNKSPPNIFVGKTRLCLGRDIAGHVLMYIYAIHHSDSLGPDEGQVRWIFP